MMDDILKLNAIGTAALKKGETSSVEPPAYLAAANATVSLNNYVTAKTKP